MQSTQYMLVFLISRSASSSGGGGGGSGRGGNECE